MYLARISGESLISQQNLHIITLSLYKFYFFFELCLVLLDFFVKSILDLGIEMNGQPIMIFELFGCIFNFSLGFSNNFIEFFYPFCDDSQYWGGLNEEHWVIYFRVGIKRSILVDFAADEKFSVSLDFFKVHLVFISLFDFFLGRPLLNRHKDLSKYFWHHIVKIVVFLISLLNHVVYYSHYFRCIVSTALLSKRHHFISTYTS